ncbi:hypothetical protein AUC70_03235 [Methyloceanibacter stevinii]|uniref:Uncharacterized protein n=1 Tax=Methyloceanibacter stevinii TaxID=1774970 RepID=A0A1E3VQU0_9HYPH|nr:hypothetical protein AUC70_03235 [Methyloceanibacter stevinii]
MPCPAIDGSQQQPQQKAIHHKKAKIETIGGKGHRTETMRQHAFSPQPPQRTKQQDAQCDKDRNWPIGRSEGTDDVAEKKWQSENDSHRRCSHDQYSCLSAGRENEGRMGSASCPRHGIAPGEVKDIRWQVLQDLRSAEDDETVAQTERVSGT